MSMSATYVCEYFAFLYGEESNRFDWRIKCRFFVVFGKSDERYGMYWYFITHGGKIMICYTRSVYIKYIDCKDPLCSFRGDVKDKFFLFHCLVVGTDLIKDCW